MEDLKLDNIKIIGPAKELFESFYKAKADIGSHVFPDGKNPHFGNEYITLDSLITKIHKANAKHNLGLMQFPTGDGLITILFHTKSGNYIESYYQLILDKQTPQGVGSALTYAKRQVLQALYGLSAGPEEDDDAEGATSHTKEPNENDYAERETMLEDPAVTNATAFKLAKTAMKDIETLEQLAVWWKDAPPVMKSNKKVQDLKDSKKAELKVLQ